MADPHDHPLLPRISHAINLLNFTVLTITGFLIHSPYPGMPMNFVRNLHFIVMYLLVFNGIVRFYYAFRGKYKDYRAFLLTPKDLKNFWPQIKYYLFLGKEPQKEKYNPLQKLTYLLLPLLTLFQLLTGLVLYRPEKFASLADTLGGLAAVRGVHYIVMWCFIAIVAIHVYLVLTEAFDQFKLMFTGKSTSRKEIQG